MTDVFTLTLAADQVTPVRAFAALRSHSPGRSSFLLESVVPGERWGRYSIVGYRARAEGIYPPGGDALALLAGDLGAAEATGAGAMGEAARQGGRALAEHFSRARVGYIAYDAVHPIHGVKPWEDEGVLARMMRGAVVAVFDHVTQTVTVAAPTRGEVNRCIWEMTHGPELRALYAPDPKALPEHLDVSMDDDAYMARVARAQEYIAAGDVFQVVLARTFRAPLRDADPLDIYRALRVLSPSPYLYFLDFAESSMAPGLTIIGASPETMVHLDGGKMTLRPIAGTRPRGGSDAEDERLAAELLADPKERAEHVMLIDLARNDVGRVAEPGTVELTAEMAIERYSHVMHIVSEVVGTPRAGVTPGEVIRAAFPAGTLTGAPKVRATEIIRELETGPRGVYGGAVGYLMPEGSLDLAIAIRTLVIRDGQVEVTAGAGIVEGSVPALEADETRNKARAALAALRAAQDAAEARAAADAAKRAKDEAAAKAKEAEEAAAAKKGEGEGG